PFERALWRSPGGRWRAGPPIFRASGPQRRVPRARGSFGEGPRFFGGGLAMRREPLDDDVRPVLARRQRWMNAVVDAGHRRDERVRVHVEARGHVLTDDLE